MWRRRRDETRKSCLSLRSHRPARKGGGFLHVVKKEGPQGKVEFFCFCFMEKGTARKRDLKERQDFLVPKTVPLFLCHTSKHTAVPCGCR